MDSEFQDKNYIVTFDWFDKPFEIRFTALSAGAAKEFVRDLSCGQARNINVALAR